MRIKASSLSFEAICDEWKIYKHLLPLQVRSTIANLASQINLTHLDIQSLIQFKDIT
jgi:hypothetical protein